MSEKIVITKEQDERIKAFSIMSSKSGILKGHMNGWTQSDNLCLNTLSIDQMARILYEPNSYEVEQAKFEVGDWVTRISGNDNKGHSFCNGRTFKVVGTAKNGITVVDDQQWYHSTNALRHATKEEIFWAELGREVNEFVDGDRIIFKDDSSFIIDSVYQSATDFVKGRLEKGRVNGFYPASSYVKLP